MFICKEYYEEEVLKRGASFKDYAVGIIFDERLRTMDLPYYLYGEVTTE
jgi:hypothetical protein